ncbi:MAG: hypothetical protein ABGY95_11990 [Rubritalea sp.]|uniref:hypothetical protein n=1 Tax=Rubritalea sp. TaxID=2109375 RepID=UPI003241E82D
MSLYLPLFFPYLLVGSLIAQESQIQPIESELAPPKVSIIALGPKPARRYSVPQYKSSDPKTIGAQTILLEPPKTSTPPCQLFYKRAGNRKWSRFNIRFNSQGALTTIPALKPLSFYSNLSINENTKPYLKLPPLKFNTKTLIFLTPNEDKTPLWKDSPMLTAIPLTRSVTGGSRVLLYNASNQVVNLLFSDVTKIPLKPGSHKNIDLNELALTNKFTLKAKGLNDSKVALQESMKNLPNRTKVYAFYDADRRTNGGRTLGVFRATYEVPD